MLINRVSILCLTTFYYGYSFVYISALGFSSLVTAYGPGLNKAYVKGLLIGCLTLGAAIGSMIAIPITPLVSKR